MAVPRASELLLDFSGWVGSKKAQSESWHRREADSNSDWSSQASWHRPSRTPGKQRSPHSFHFPLSGPGFSSLFLSLSAFILSLLSLFSLSLTPFNPLSHSLFPLLVSVLLVATLAASLRTPPDTRNDDEEDFWGEKGGLGIVRGGGWNSPRTTASLPQILDFTRSALGFSRGVKGEKGVAETVGLEKRWGLG